MMSVIRTFFFQMIALSALFAMLSAPSNASAMIDCLDLSKEQGVTAYLGAVDHDHVHAPSMEKNDHENLHCQSHVCTTGLFNLVMQEASAFCVERVVGSWDATSLVSMSAPEGLRRPPRA